MDRSVGHFPFSARIHPGLKRSGMNAATWSKTGPVADFKGRPYHRTFSLLTTTVSRAGFPPRPDAERRNPRLRCKNSALTECKMPNMQKHGPPFRSVENLPSYRLLVVQKNIRRIEENSVPGRRYTTRNLRASPPTMTSAVLPKPPWHCGSIRAKPVQPKPVTVSLRWKKFPPNLPFARNACAHR